MYKKHKQLDVMFSTVLLFFAVAVTLGILTYTELGQYGKTIDYYFLFSYTIVMGMLTLYHLITYILCINHKRNDYVIDFEQETLTMSKRKVVPFDQIKLIAYRKNRDEIKLFFKHEILNVIASHLTDDNGNKLELEHAKELGKHAHLVDHKHLYNYSFMSLYETQFVFFFYTLFQSKLPIFTENENLLVVFGCMVLIQIFVFFGNLIRLNMKFNKLEEEKHIQEDTN